MIYRENKERKKKNTLGIDSRESEIFRTRPDRTWAPPVSCTMGTGSFPGVKRPGRGANHPNPSSAEVMKW
jgi:hypothetical protein